jgi:hypothetical protein
MIRKIIKILIIVLIIGLIGGALYLFVGVGADSSDSGLTFASDREAGVFSLATPALTSDQVDVDSTAILKLFRDVSSITINSGVLDDPAFTALTSIFVPIATPTEIGRTNPFLEIGANGSREVRVGEESIVEEVLLEQSSEDVLFQEANFSGGSGGDSN